MPVKIDGGGYINSPYLGTANNIYTDGTGKVGIGTSTPTNLLEVAGSAANIYLRSNDTGDATLRYMGASSERATVRATSTNALLVETGGVERLRIDGSGRVTKPYQPAFRAHLSGGWTHPSGVQLIQGTWVAPVNNGNYYDTTNRKFTAPVAGHYHFDAMIATVGGTAAFSYLSAEIWVNGARTFIGGWDGGGTSYGQVSSSTVLYLSASDYVQLACEANKTFTLETGAIHTTLSGYLIG